MIELNKNIFLTALATATALFQLLYLPACQKADAIKIASDKPEIELLGASIDPSTGARSIRKKVVHLFKDTVYLLNETFTREVGEQLIIDAGTLIKAKVAGSPIGSIIINPGGLITATGSADHPIVFTSNQNESTQAANWGGIIIKGRSFNNANGTVGDAADFSGVLQYVRVEFAPLALEAVGNKTVIENVMVSYTNRAVFDQYQSSFSIFGGTFNARNLISYASAGPADIFITNGYSGNMQNIIACRHPFFGKTGSNPDNSLAGVFIQNNSFNPLGAKPFTNPVISNLTVLGPDSKDGAPGIYADTNSRSGALVTTSGTCFQIRNSVFLGFPAAGWFLNDKPIADNLQKRSVVEFNYSIVHCNTPSRVFYLEPGTAGVFTSDDFKNYMIGPFFSNKYFTNSGDFRFRDIMNFDRGPNLMPAESSPLLSGANFTGSGYFTKDFFDKTINYVGAMGTDNWTKGWTNFSPLKTNYNFPH